MHRGAYAYDSGGSALIKEEAHAQSAKKLAAYIVPLWVKAAPRAAAKAYVKRIRTLFPDMPTTPAALLAHSTPLEISVVIPSSLIGFSISQLQLPTSKAYNVKGASLELTRLSAQGKKLDASGAVKVDTGDTLLLRGTPHVLATVAGRHGGHLTLLKPKEAEAMRKSLHDERQALMIAAEELAHRLARAYRRQQHTWAYERRRRSAATRLQARARGMAAREAVREDMERLVRRRRRAMLKVRRTAAAMARKRLNGPILSGALLRRLALPPSVSTALHEMEEEEPSIFAAIGARRGKIARAYTTAINTLLIAAPEGVELGAPMPLIDLLCLQPTSLTARISTNERTMSSLQLPADVAVLRYVINKKKVEVRSQTRLDPSVKLLKGDDITVCAQPHRLALILEARNAKLIVAPKQRGTEAEELAKGRENLVALLAKLAHWLQSRVRIRIAQRLVARKAFAAVAIQCAFADFHLRQGKSFKISLTRRGTIVKHTARASPFGVAKLDAVGYDAPTSQSFKATRSISWGVAPATDEFDPTDGSNLFGLQQHHLGWADMRTKHRLQIAAAATMKGELKRVRQKKKPSQVRKGSPEKPTGGSRKLAVKSPPGPG